MNIIHGDAMEQVGWTRYWECYIEPDWLLVWEEDDNEVRLARTGTHAYLVT